MQTENPIVSFVYVLMIPMEFQDSNFSKLKLDSINRICLKQARQKLEIPSPAPSCTVTPDNFESNTGTSLTLITLTVIVCSVVSSPLDLALNIEKI